MSSQATIYAQNHVKSLQESLEADEIVVRTTGQQNENVSLTHLERLEIIANYLAIIVVIILTVILTLICNTGYKYKLNVIIEYQTLTRN